MADRSGANHTSYRVEMAWAFNDSVTGVNLGDLRRMISHATAMDDDASVVIEELCDPNPATPTERHAGRITIREDYYDEDTDPGVAASS